MRFASQLLLLLLLAVPAHAADRIVLPGAPSPTESFAADELQRYVLRLTGRKLPIQREGEGGAAPAFFVGRCAGSDRWTTILDHAVREIREDSFVLAPDGAGLRLLGGGDRGTLYAVYALLERQGCRWFEPGERGETVPRIDVLDVPRELVV